MNKRMGRQFYNGMNGTLDRDPQGQVLGFSPLSLNLLVITSLEATVAC